MIAIYYLLFLLISGLITYSYLEKKHWKLTFGVIGFILIFFAGIRGDIDADHTSYIGMYSRFSEFKGLRYFDFSDLGIVEPTFALLSMFIKTIFHHSFFLFLFYAVLGVSSKLIAIRKLAPEYYLLPLLFYSTHFFFLHEMTQIRAGVACGISFASLLYVKERMPLRFIFAILLATSFHYSSVMFLPIYFLQDKMNIKVWASVLFFASLMAFLPFSFISIFQKIPFFGVFTDKIASYQQLAEGGIINQINLFNAYILLNQFVLIVLLVIGKDHIESVPYLSLLIKINIIGVLAFMGFKDLPVMSFRIYEFMAFSQVFLFSSFILFFKEKKIIYISLLFIALFCLVIDVSIGKLMSPYAINTFSYEY